MTLSKPIGRRGFLGGVIAIAGAAAAAAIGLVAWRKRNDNDGEAVSSVAEAGIFGEWIDDRGLPALRYMLDQRSDPRATYTIRDGIQSTLNWHHLGNDATSAIAANDGWVQLFDFSHGSRWMNYWDPVNGRYAGGFGYIYEDGAVIPTLYADANQAALAERIFGAGYFDNRLTANDLEIDRRVMLPFGEATWLLSRISIRNLSNKPRSIRHFEYWDINPRWLTFGSTDDARAEAAKVLEYDVTAKASGLHATERQADTAQPLREPRFPRVPPEPGPMLFLIPVAGTPADAFDTDPERFFGGGRRDHPDAVANGACTGSAGSPHPCFVYQSNIELPPNGETTLWFAYGYTYDALPDFPVNPAAEERRSLDAWKSWLPTFNIPEQPAVARELTWHAYYARASSFYDGFFGRRTIPQGFWYLYGSGFNAGLRDSAQHALPMVYFEPALARDVLLSIYAQQDETGHFPYSMTGYGIAYDFIWQPGDYDIWALWISAEYVLATRDLQTLDEPLAFYPPATSPTVPLWDHMVLSYHHLRDTVGVGQSGLLHARNADWNDGLVFEAGGDDPAAFIKNGESTLASAFGAWVLDRFANLARERAENALADEVESFASSLRERLREVWTGRWMARAVLPSGELFGSDRLHLEPQPWAILAGVTSDRQTDSLLAEIDTLLRAGSPLGARLLSALDGVQPSGESTQGGVWMSITHTLIWAAARHNPTLAWDEFLRNTMQNHAMHYPDVWVGTWSGPDAYNSDWSTRPGWTWDLPALNVYGQIWPIQNVHTHSQPLMSFLRLAGVEATQAGIRIDPAFPFEDWSIDSPTFALAYAPSAVSGRTKTAGLAIEIQVRLPKGLVGKDLRVTSLASNVGYEQHDGSVVLKLEGPSDGAWDWQIEPA